MNPHPHIYRVNGRPLPGMPPSVCAQVTAACRVIERRTGFTAWYHAGNQSVQYHPGRRPHMAPTADYLSEGGRYNPIDIDSACQRIFRSNQSLWRKERDLDRAEQRKLDERERALDNHADTVAGSLVGEILHNINRARNPHSQRVFVMS